MTIFLLYTFSSHGMIGMPWIEFDIFSRSRMIWNWPGRNPAFHLTALWKPQSAFTACSVGVKTFCLSYSGIPVRLSKLAQRARLKAKIQRRGSKAAELCHTWTYAPLIHIFSIISSSLAEVVWEESETHCSIRLRTDRCGGQRVA